MVAFFVGVCLSGISIFYLKDKFMIFDERNTVTAFQVGVFKSYENAKKTSENYPGSIAVFDGDYYRVYIGVAKDKDCEELLATYFLNQNINVYLKEIEVTQTFFQEINLVEKEIDKNDMEVFELMNQEMMKKLEGEIL